MTTKEYVPHVQILYKNIIRVERNKGIIIMSKFANRQEIFSDRRNIENITKMKWFNGSGKGVLDQHEVYAYLNRRPCEHAP
jgi:hypothetical protein